MSKRDKRLYKIFKSELNHKPVFRNTDIQAKVYIALVYATALLIRIVG